MNRIEYKGKTYFLIGDYWFYRVPMTDDWIPVGIYGDRTLNDELNTEYFKQTGRMLKQELDTWQI